MSENITLGLLSRCRTPELRTAVNSALAMASRALDVVIVFDDDLLGYNMCPDWSCARKFLISPRHYYCRAANSLFKLAATVTDNHYLFFTHDDVEFVKPNWTEIVVGAFENIFDDGQGGILEVFSPGLCSHYLTTFDFIKREFDGRLAYPLYTNYYSDSHMLNECAARHRYGALRLATEDAILNHQRYSTRDAPSWEVQRAWLGQDKDLYAALWPEERETELKANWKVFTIKST